MWHGIGHLLLPRVVFWISSGWFTGLKTCLNVMGLTGGSYPLCAWVMETQTHSCYCCSFGSFSPRLVWMINTLQTKLSLLSLVAITLWYGEYETRHCLLRRVRTLKAYEIDLILISVVCFGMGGGTLWAFHLSQKPRDLNVFPFLLVARCDWSPKEERTRCIMLISGISRKLRAL